MEGPFSTAIAAFAPFDVTYFDENESASYLPGLWYGPVRVKLPRMNVFDCAT